MRIDLPAPVSPVSTVKPGANSSSSRSTITKSRMLRLRSMGAENGKWRMGNGEARSNSDLLFPIPHFLLPGLFPVPVELLPQHPVVAVSGRVQQAQGALITAHLHAVAFPQIEPRMAVQVDAGIRRAL